MTDIYSYVDSLVSAVKENTGNENIRFIHSYKPIRAERPLKGLLAVMNISEVSVKRNSDPEGKIHIKLYGDSTYSGETLGMIAGSLAEDFTQADTDGVISGTKVAGVSYDRNNGAIYRDIYIELKPSAEEEPDDSVYLDNIEIDGAAIDGVLSYTVQQNTDSDGIREILTGDLWAESAAVCYNIRLKYKGESAADFGVGFTLSILSGGGGAVYGNCLLKSAETYLDSDGGIMTVLTITAGEMERYG